VATDDVRHAEKIRQLTMAPLLAEAMVRIAEDRSVSSLFEGVKS
jgi:ribose-phosphate pyrophosphokinase